MFQEKLNMSTMKTIIINTWRLILPLSTSRLIVMITSFTGILIIAQLGKTVLAASALISSVQAFLFFAGFSLLFSVSAMVGHAYGGKRHEEVGSIFQQALLFGLLVSTPMIIIQWNIGHILLLFGQEAHICNLIQDYFRYYSLGTPALACSLVCQQFVLAVNKRRLVFLLSIFSLIISVGFALALVNGYAGLPKMGIAGLGLAYSIQSWLVLLIYIYYCYTEPEFSVYALFSWRIHHTFHFLKQLFHIGWPITIQTSSDVLAFFLFTVLSGWLGDNALAAQQIANQYFFLLCVPIFAIAQASTILIGQARGANEIANISRYAYTTLGFSLLFSLLVLLIFILFPHYLIDLYVSNHNELSAGFKNLASTLLIIMGCRLVFDAIFEIKVGSLRGLYDTRYSMVVTILFLLVFNIPCAYILGFVFHWGLIGMMLSSLMMTILAVIALWRRWQVILERTVGLK